MGTCCPCHHKNKPDYVLVEEIISDIHGQTHRNITYVSYGTASNVNSNKTVHDVTKKRYSHKGDKTYDLDDKSLFMKEKVGRDFYRKDCITLSKELLGKLLVRVLDDGTVLSGLIIETEAYLGGNDKAAHSYNNRQTEKNKSMFLDAGHCYIYLSFRGHNDCFNITSDKQGVPAAVLIRAVYPLSGFQIMKKRRREIGQKRNPTIQNLCSGPALLCQSFDLSRAKFNGIDMVNSDTLYVEQIVFGKIKNIEFGETLEESLIIATPRINVQYAGEEWASKLLRFCLKGFETYRRFPSKKFSSKTNVMIWPEEHERQNC
eukprot:256986_1